jgi:hypothetical protein
MKKAIGIAALLEQCVCLLSLSCTRRGTESSSSSGTCRAKLASLNAESLLVQSLSVVCSCTASGALAGAPPHDKSRGALLFTERLIVSYCRAGAFLDL